MLAVVLGTAAAFATTSLAARVMLNRVGAGGVECAGRPSDAGRLSRGRVLVAVLAAGLARFRPGTWDDPTEDWYGSEAVWHDASVTTSTVIIIAERAG